MRKILAVMAACTSLVYGDSKQVIDLLEASFEALLPAQEKSAEAFVWFSKVPYPLFNSVMHLSYEGKVGEKIDAILAKAPENTPLCFWLHPLNRCTGLAEALRERGFVSAGLCPAMEWKVGPVAAPKLLPDHERVCQNLDSDFSGRQSRMGKDEPKNRKELCGQELEVKPADMKIFHEIMGRALQLDPAVKEGLEKFLKSDKIESFLVYFDGKPVGTGSLMILGKKGAIFNVAVLPEFQRKGAGTAISQAMMRRAYELRLEDLVLQSSPEAEKLYSNLGFKKVFEIELYIR